LASFIGKWNDDGGNECTAIYPQYMDSIENPVYPAITIYEESSRTLKNRTGYEEKRYYIHGWSKNNDASYMRNLVVATLDVDSILGNKVYELAMCRKVDGRCPLYDSQIKTHYFMTEWLIHARKSLMNA
jgi:hypothetical protein